MGLTRAGEFPPFTQRVHVDWERGLLVGTVCGNCETRSWPPRPVCPRCGSDDTKALDLPRVGSLVTYTTVWVPRPGLPSPYVLGEVVLHTGLTVFGHVRDLPDDPQLPMAVELVTNPAKQGVPSFWFRPKSASEESTPSTEGEGLMSDAVPSEDVPPYKRGVVFIDGQFVPGSSAAVSVYDHSFLYGDGVFESIVCRNKHPYALDAHLDRLRASCAYLKIDLPYDHTKLARILHDLLEKNRLSDGYVRIVVSRGDGYPVSDPYRATSPTVVLSVQAEPAFRPPRDDGLDLIIASTRRIPPVCMDPRIKSNNYLNLIAAKLEARAAGADDAILLDVHGHVAELPVANVFVRQRDRLLTPPPHNILAGITRRTMFRLVHEGAALPVETVAETVMTPYDLYTADEAFAVGTGIGVAPIRSVDGRTIGLGKPGWATRQLMDAYEALLAAVGEGRPVDPATTGS